MSIRQQGLAFRRYICKVLHTMHNMLSSTFISMEQCVKENTVCIIGYAYWICTLSTFYSSRCIWNRSNFSTSIGSKLFIRESGIRCSDIWLKCMLTNRAIISRDVSWWPWALFQYENCLSRYSESLYKNNKDCLIFIMGIPNLVSCHLYIETAPEGLCVTSKVQVYRTLCMIL